MTTIRAGAWVTLAAALLAAPAKGGEGAAAFTRKPAAARAGDKVRIEFAVSRETDVAVFIEDAKGQVVRHLVAGVLGQNPPAPLKANSLDQSVEWDGRADYGKPAAGGPFKVRVALGLGAKYDKVLISDPLTVGGVNCLAVGPDGTAYAMIGCGGTGPVWSGQQMVAFNRDGSYQRMLMPFPSNLKIAEAKGFDVVELDGRPAPLVHAIQARNFYPAATGRKAGMAVTPDGQILTLAGFNLGALDTQGGSPWGAYLGPKLLALQRGRFAGRPFIAASADGKTAYVSGLMDYLPDKKPPEVVSAAVYRVKLPERGPAEPFFGDPKQAGNDETHLGGAPHGLACDGKGQLLIADHKNGRVVAVTEKDGKFAGSFAVEAPDCLGVDPETGAVYLTRLTGKGNVELVKYSGWKDARELAKLPVKSSGNPDCPWLMAADVNAKPPVVWLGSDGGQILRIEDQGGKFGEAKEISKGSIGNASFVDVSVDRFRKEIYSRCGMYWWYRFNEETGELIKVQPREYPSAAGSQLAVAPDGNLYSPAYAHHLLKFGRDGKALPWHEGYTGYSVEQPGKDGKTSKFAGGPNAIYVPVSMTFLTHTVGIRHDGRIFMFEPGHPGDRPPKMLCEYDPSGKKAGGPIIWKVSDSAVGPKFDPQGNIYIAEQIKPQDQPYPPEFKSFVGEIKLSSTYLEGLKGEVPSMYGSIVKFSPKGGMIHFGGENPFKGEPSLDPQLKTADAASFHGYRLYPTKVTGAEWMRMGVSHVDIIGCNCENTRFDVDEFGRVFYPDLGRFRVGVLDTAGNEIVHFGGYGNAESMGPDSPVIDPKTGKVRPRRPDDPKDLKSPFAEPEIAFSWLIGVGATDRYAYMGDSLNRRLLRARLVYAAEETCPVQ